MKYAVVTGGTKGIGLAVVKELLQRGFYVFTNYANDTNNALIVSAQLKKISEHIEIIKANQSNKTEFEEFIIHIKQKTHTIDCIICNAGLTIRKPTMELADEDWEKIMQVSVNAHFYLIRDLYRLIPNNARIIFIGSVLGIFPHATSLPYGVSKAAVHALARNLVKEFEGTGTTVNVIAPGFVETEWQKSKAQEIRNSIYRKSAIKRFANTEEISSAVTFCIDNPFVNGSIIEVNGGYCFK